MFGGRIYQSRELADVREPDKFSAREFFFRHDFVLPGGLVRTVNRAAAHFDHGQDVRPDRIPDHQEAMRRDLVPGDDGLIGLSDFDGDDFDLAEMARQPRTSDLGLLLEEVALGDQHQLMRGGQRRERLFDAIEEFDRGFEHLTGQFDDPAYLGAADTPFCQFDRRFDHRERETFDAVTVMFKVADFGLVHPALYPLLVVIMREYVEYLPLRSAIDRLVVPQRVVRVECDYVEHKIIVGQTLVCPSSIHATDRLKSVPLGAQPPAPQSLRLALSRQALHSFSL